MAVGAKSITRALQALQRGSLLAKRVRDARLHSPPAVPGEAGDDVVEHGERLVLALQMTQGDGLVVQSDRDQLRMPAIRRPLGTSKQLVGDRDCVFVPIDVDESPGLGGDRPHDAALDLAIRLVREAPEQVVRGRDHLFVATEVKQRDRLVAEGSADAAAHRNR